MQHRKPRRLPSEQKRKSSYAMSAKRDAEIKKKVLEIHRELVGGRFSPHAQISGNEQNGLKGHLGTRPNEGR